MTCINKTLLSKVLTTAATCWSGTSLGSACFPRTHAHVVGQRRVQTSDCEINDVQHPEVQPQHATHIYTHPVCVCRWEGGLHMLHLYKCRKLPPPCYSVWTWCSLCSDNFICRYLSRCKSSSIYTICISLICVCVTCWSVLQPDTRLSL